MSKKIKTTRKATRVVGTKRYIDEQTGEIEEMQVIETEERDANFHKLWLAHIIESLELIGNKKLKVLTFIMQNLNRDNLFLMTYKEIESHTGISQPTIAETMKALQEANFLKKIRAGVYAINPNTIFKGGKNDRLNVLIKYQQLQNEEQKTKTKYPEFDEEIVQHGFLQ